MNDSNVAISREVFRRLMRAIANFLKSPVGGKARWLLLALFILLGAFSLIITQFQAIFSYASVIARLDEFVEHAERHVVPETQG